MLSVKATMRLNGNCVGAEISHRQSGAIKMCKLAVAGNNNNPHRRRDVRAHPPVTRILITADSREQPELQFPL